jgi:hypothetical protein
MNVPSQQGRGGAKYGQVESGVQTVLVLKDIIRRYPDVVTAYAATLQTLPVSDLQTSEAAAAYCWIRAEMASQGIPDTEGVEPVRFSAVRMASAHSHPSRVHDSSWKQRCVHEKQALC